MLFANAQSWAHILDAAARITGLRRERLLDAPERAALDGEISPHGPIF